MAGPDKPVGKMVDLAGTDQPIEVPSGQPVTLLDVVQDVPGTGGLTVRFRFVAPEIAREGGRIGVDQAMVDMEYLCRTYALPRISEIGPQPAQIVISLADVAVPFGEAAPDATQYFEGYRVENGTCIWEPF